MQVAIRRVLPSARQRLARPQRFSFPTLTRLRFGAPVRCFINTPAFLQASNDAPTSESAALGKAGSTENPDTVAEKKEAVDQPGAERESTNTPAVPREEMVSSILATNGTESASDRTQRRNRPIGVKNQKGVRKVEVPKPVIPDWFIEHSVMLKEQYSLESSVLKLGIYSVPSEITAKSESTQSETPSKVVETAKTESEISPTEETAGAEPKVLCVRQDTPNAKSTRVGATPAQEVMTEAQVGSRETAKERYQLHEWVWKEVTTHVRTGLLLPKVVFIDGLASTKSHCLLHLPKEGGIYYLDAVTEKLAAEVGADLIRIDAQDLAEIAGDYLGDSQRVSTSDISPMDIRSLAYDTQLTTSHDPVAEEESGSETIEEAYEDEDDMMESASPAPLVPLTFNILNSLPTQLQQLIRSGRLANATLVPMVMGPDGEPSFSGTQTKEQLLDRVYERKMAILLDALISAGQLKRIGKQSSSDITTETTSNKTIIHVRDYKELEETNSGQALLKMLHNIVQGRRRDGERVIVLGTTSTEESLSTYSKTGVNNLQSCSDELFERTIVIPPVTGAGENEIFKQDRDSRVRELNIRHLRDVIRRRSGESGESTALVVPGDWHLNPGEDSEPKIPGIETSVWDFGRVHRVASVALGQLSTPPQELSIADIAEAVQTIIKSDDIKFIWAAQEQEYLKERNGPERPEEKVKKALPKNLTAHEKKLVAGIIDPKDIHTRFSSVRAPPETIDTMKTLTSLSLVRPEAFKYGVLATDRIPGVLLYGPPGTGKTLLARAVAKESGATVLEVSGGDIFNMYVGEGEKNVKAIFSLAKKLSPCVIFIDEADAIFGSRQSFSNRSSHREIINQFLKEWADMDSTAFIMVATNRPFDLDDAILRRLPRRILIDLPTPEDRLEILKIHLSSETLDESVDLKEIADRGSLYSGSDLKNLCVSAALACVKEENAEFEKTGKYPEKRILTKRHFDKAAGEISASISDDMGSLGLIRKFDDKYGERGAGKKKKSTWGFEVGQTESAKRNEGRVRMD